MKFIALAILFFISTARAQLSVDLTNLIDQIGDIGAKVDSIYSKLSRRSSEHDALSINQNSCVIFKKISKIAKTLEADLNNCQNAIDQKGDGIRKAVKVLEAAVENAPQINEQFSKQLKALSKTSEH